jgi:hypothetical protein
LINRDITITPKSNTKIVNADHKAVLEPSLTPFDENIKKIAKKITKTNKKIPKKTSANPLSLNIQ